LVVQAKNKYSSPKYRFVVRITNKDIICQVMYAKLTGDICLTAAYSHELPRYGIEVGLTNWAAAYATGLLAARRLLQKLKLDETYVGAEEVDGEYFTVEEKEGEPRPFKAFLDVGLRRTTTGARIFGALKGAVDGGLAIPYSESRFPGYDKDSKKGDPEMVRSYIFGTHVADYMEYLQEDDEEMYKKHFAKYVELGIEPDALEEMYEKAHEKIRADPSPQKKTPLTAEAKKALQKYKTRRTNTKQKKNRVAQKIAAFERARAAA
jgi:large subunit ribosomal protein L5e